MKNKLFKNTIFLILVTIWAMAFDGAAFAANTAYDSSDGHTGYYYVQASVDTDPGANGYGAEAVNVKEAGRITEDYEVWFFISSIGTDATITLQWKRANNLSWTDYEDYTEVTRKVIHDRSHGMYWRAIVKDDNQGSGGFSVFGIDW